MAERILVVTDFPAGGSGYATISQPICNGLIDLGYEVIVLGISNNGEEHWNKFGIIPMGTDLREVEAAIHNLSILWQPKILLVALDIPMQEQIYYRVIQDDACKDLKYIAITPMENGPLSPSWAGLLMKLDKVFFISQLGEDEAKKAGVETAEHLVVGIDNKVWYPAAPEERTAIRKNLGYDENDKVFLTVADNQERKNFDTAFQIVSNFKKLYPDIPFKYVIVTKENTPYGWKPMELAVQYGIQKELIVFERGMPKEQLRLLYVSADVFLLTSKAEGLGMPVMEALSCGVNCVATDTGALHEKLTNGVGWLIPVSFSIKHDVWGHSKRDFADPFVGAKMLHQALQVSSKSYKFPTDIMISQVSAAIREMLDV